MFCLTDDFQTNIHFFLRTKRVSTMIMKIVAKNCDIFFSLRMIWTVNVFVNCHFTMPFASHLPTFSRFFNFLTRFEVEIYTENTPRKLKLVEYILYGCATFCENVFLFVNYSQILWPRWWCHITFFYQD